MLVIAIAVLGITSPLAAIEASNLQLMTDTTTQALDIALESFVAPEDRDSALLLVAQEKHDANWLLEHLLLEQLLLRGFGVTLDSTGADAAAPRLDYRITDASISGRAGIFGGMVTRRCRVALRLHLSEEGEIRWNADGLAELEDRIPKNQLEALQRSEYGFAKTDLDPPTWGKYVEPIIVTTVLGSLVYLFFSNR